MFEEGQIVYSLKYGTCRIKKIVGTACTVVTNQPMCGSLVHIVKVDSLRPASKEAIAWFNSQKEKVQNDIIDSFVR